MQSDSKMHGEGQGFPTPYVKGWRFFHRIAGPITATLSDL